MAKLVSRTLLWLAIAGVPTAVMVLTGGFSTFGFWVEVLVLAAVSWTFGLLPATFLYLPLAGLLYIATALIPKRREQVMEISMYVFYALAGAVAFVLLADGLSTSHVDLPIHPVGLGALAVMAAATATMALLLFLAGLAKKRLPGRRGMSEYRSPAPLSLTRPGRAVLPYPLPTSVESPEEMWLPSGIVAWRAWSWDGQTLHGMWVPWHTPSLEAQCDQCDESPGWVHPCGIYSFREAGDVRWIGEWGTIIGRVELSGLVVEHRLGYRASKARILEIWVPDEDNRQSLADRYPGVEVWVGVPPEVLWKETEEWPT